MVAIGVGQFSLGAALGKEETFYRWPPPNVSPTQRHGALLVQITGNSSVADKTLLDAAMEELNDFHNRGGKDADADDAAYQIELAYRRMGYRFATVDFVIERQEGRVAKLVFNVLEGKRVRLAEIVFAGNQRIPAETLLAFVRSGDDDPSSDGNWFVESRIRGAIEEIRSYYKNNGYLQCRVNDPEFLFSEDNSEVTVQISIEEGMVFLVHDLALAGDLLPEITDRMNGIRESLIGKPYVPRQTTYLVESRIAELYGDLGYPEAKVEVARDEGLAMSGPAGAGDKAAVQLEALIKSGPLVEISGIKITGNYKTSEEFIRSRLVLAEGETYSLAKERTSFRNLYRTGLFSLVRLSLIETETLAQRQLLVEVEELPFREISLDAGWGSYEMLRGKIELRRKNFMGKGRILSASTAASLRSTDLGVGITDPWLLGKDLVLDLPVFYRTREEPSFEKTETGVSTVVSKYFTGQQVGVSLGYSLRAAKLSNVSVDVGGAADDYNFAALKLQTYRDTRDDLFFPASGYNSIFTLELSDKSLGSSLAFLRFVFNNRFFIALAPRTVLAARYDTGFVLPTTEDLTLPLTERFFNGGENSVRSFRESELGPKDENSGDPLGGSAFNVLSVELRHRFKNNFVGTIFADYGNIAPSGDAALDHFTTRSEFVSATFRDYFTNFRPALGAGIQYLLPVGPLRLDVAFNPSVDEEQKENEYIVHFTVGMAF